MGFMNIWVMLMMILRTSTKELSENRQLTH